MDRASRRPLLGTLLIIMLLGLASACASSTPKELRIGVMATFTGTAGQDSGRSTREGAGLAVQEFNAAGGLVIEGQPYTISLVFADDESTPDIAVSAVRELISQDKVVGLIGPQYSNVAIPVSVIAEQAQLPMISPMSTNPETTANKRFVFRAGFLDSQQGLAMAEFAYRSLEGRSAAVIYDIANRYNRELAEIFRDRFEEFGGTVVAFEGYTTGTTDFRPAMERIAAAEPDVVFLPNLIEDTLPQGLLARELGVDAVFLGSDAWAPYRLTGYEAFDGAYFTRHWSHLLDTERSQEFVDAYEARYNRLPLSTAAMTYDATWMLLEAMKQAASLEPEQIRAALAGLRYDGVSGTIVFAGNGDPQKQVVIEEIRNGDIVFHQTVGP